MCGCRRRAQRRKRRDEQSSARRKRMEDEEKETEHADIKSRDPPWQSGKKIKMWIEFPT